jgi:hypothetical protein
MDYVVIYQFGKIEPSKGHKNFDLSQSYKEIYEKFIEFASV